MSGRSCLILISASLAFSLASTAQAAERIWVLVGTYTGGGSEGVYVLNMDLETGALTRHSVMASDNPSFLAVHPDGRHVYAANETSNFQGTQAGAISAFNFDAREGRLSLINQQSSRGSGPCHLVVDHSGRYVLAANYGGGSVCVLPVDNNGGLHPASSFVQHTGSSVNPGRQKEPHAHSINVDPSNRFVVAADLGIDKVLIYRLNSRHGNLTANGSPYATVAPGSGPRHFAFHPDGRFGYVINELLLTVTAFAIDDDGRMTEVQTISTLPPDTKNTGSTAEIRVHPSGRFLYGSNRGHDSIVVYTIDQDTGRLTWVENEPTGGQTPRNFYVEPSGRWLLAENQSSGSIVVLKINQDTGALEPSGQRIDIPSPVCIRTIAVAE